MYHKSEKFQYQIIFEQTKQAKIKNTKKLKTNYVMNIFRTVAKKQNFLLYNKVLQKNFLT